MECNKILAVLLQHPAMFFLFSKSKGGLGHDATNPTAFLLLPDAFRERFVDILMAFEASSHKPLFQGSHDGAPTHAVRGPS